MILKFKKYFLVALICIIILMIIYSYFQKRILESFYILSPAMENCPRPSCPKPDLPSRFKKMSKDDAKKYIENQISSQVDSNLNYVLNTYREISVQNAYIKTNPDQDDEDQAKHYNTINSFLIYKNSIYKIGVDKKLYQKFLNGGNWFLLTENYNPSNYVKYILRDFTIIEENNKLYIYALFGNDLVKKDLSDNNSSWVKQKDIKSFSKVITITNTKDKLFFTVESSEDDLIELQYISNEEEEQEEESGGAMIDTESLFSLSNPGIYYKSLTEPVLSVINNFMGTFKDEPNRAFRTMTGNVNSVDLCSESCKSFKYFGLQNWNGKESTCFCDNNLNSIQKYGETECGKLGGPWCNAVYNRQVTDIQNYLLSDKYKLIRVNTYSKSDIFYGLYLENSEISVVKKSIIENNNPYDDKFEFSVQFVDLFLTNSFLYGLGKDGNVYRKSIQVNFFGEESRSWYKVTTHLIYLSSLKIDEKKKLSVYDNFVYALDKNVIRKHYIMGYEWLSIDNNDYVDQYYTKNPNNLIKQINSKTKTYNFLDHDSSHHIPSEKLSIGIDNKYIKL